MIVSCLRVEVPTKRNHHGTVTTRERHYFGSVEETENKDANVAVDFPMEEDYEQELAEAWDDNAGQELDPEVVRKARFGDGMVQEVERVRERKDP